MNQISLLLVFGIIRVMRVVGFWFMTPIFPAVTVSLLNEANQDQDGALGFFSSSKSPPEFPRIFSPSLVSH